MSTAIQQGHAFAFGMRSRFGQRYDAQIRALGYAWPEEPQKTEFAIRGWWPVVVYPAATAPVTAPRPGAQFVVVAFRSGSSSSLAAWPWGAVMPLSEVVWVLDLSPGVP